MSSDDFPDIDPSFSQQPQGPAPQGYSQYPQDYGQYPPPRPYCQLAIWSICLSGAGFICCAIPSIPGIITGHIALKQIKESGDQLDGKPLAITGLVLGYVLIALVALYILFYALFFGFMFTAMEGIQSNRSFNPPGQHQPAPSQQRPYGLPSPDQPPADPAGPGSSDQEPALPPASPEGPSDFSQGKQPPPEQPDQ